MLAEASIQIESWCAVSPGQSGNGLHQFPTPLACFYTQGILAAGWPRANLAGQASGEIVGIGESAFFFPRRPYHSQDSFTIFFQLLNLENSTPLKDFSNPV